MVPLKRSRLAGLIFMLTQEEERFIQYWEANRSKQKKTMVQKTIGLPLAAFIVVAIFINAISGWYKRADAEIRVDTSQIIVILIACVGIVGFIVFFSAKYHWEQNEQRYAELILKKREEEKTNL